MSVVPTLSGPPLYRYIPGVGKVSAAVNGPTGPQGPPGTAANTGATGPTGVPSPIGNTLTVDAVYGNDTTAAADPYAKPFLTISAALSNATSGQLVFVNPGTYNESLTIPAGVSLNGSGAQAVVVQRLNVTSNVTLLTMGSNCRVENLTANLSSSSNVNLIGVDFPTGTIPSAKLRNSIWTVTSTATGSNTIIGCRSAGTSTNPADFNSPNAIQRSTLNVISSSTGPTRGVLVSGANRFAVRDIVVYARGTGTDIVGLETTHASAVGDFKTSSIFGTTNDIKQTLGSITLSATDLINHNADAKSFTTTTASPQLTYGITKNINNAAATRYLLPGNTDFSALETSAIGIPFQQSCIVYQVCISATSSLPVGAVGTVNLYINSVSAGTKFLTASLTSSSQMVLAADSSQKFVAATDKLIVEFVTSGSVSIGNIPIIVGVSYY